jgi:hypothetical protein
VTTMHVYQKKKKKKKKYQIEIIVFGHKRTYEVCCTWNMASAPFPSFGYLHLLFFFLFEFFGSLGGEGPGSSIILSTFVACG